MTLSPKQKRFLKWFLYSIGTLLMLVVFFIFSVYTGIWGALPSSKELKELSQYRASEIYDINNELIGKFYIENRQPIPLDSMPQHLLDATIATEDARFFEHSGVDTRSMFRVLFKSILMQNQSAGGGSTLTQQLAKNLYKRKSFSIFTLPVAKTKEILIARRLEQIYSKDKILELYLNSAPFSGNTHGVESASRKFFNKPASRLSVAEAATLVGTLKATTYYNPYRFPERSTERRNVVLSQMRKYEFLDTTAHQMARKEVLELDFASFDEQRGLAPYFREKLRQRMLIWCKENTSLIKQPNLYTSGLKIYTTIDKKMQEYAEEATVSHLQHLQQQFENEYGSKAPWKSKNTIFLNKLKQTSAYKKLADKGYNEKAILDALNKKKRMVINTFGKKRSVRYSTIDSLSHYMKFLSSGTLILDSSGAVRAWVGGANYENNKYDHVLSKRQVGSTFKPIVYTAGLESGLLPCDYYSAKGVVYENMDNWSPTNSGNKNEKYLNYSMQEALTQSVNTVSVKILEKTGISNVIELAENLNITSELPEVPSLALGTAELSVHEMAGAYTSYINESTATTPYYLLKIENAQGKELEVFDRPKALKKAYSESSRQQIIAMMQSVVSKGTASRIRKNYNIKSDLAGKTGTTQANKDAWFVGVTPKLVAVTWVGHDDHRIGFKSTRVGQGANAALPIVAKFLQKINSDKSFDSISKARFAPMDRSVVESLDCDPTKRDGFLKRLFTNPDKKKKRDFKNKKS